MKRSDLIFNVLLLPLDFFLLFLAALAAYFVRVSPVVADIRPVLFELPFRYFMTLATALVLMNLVIFALTGLYSMRRKVGVFTELSSITIAVSAGMTLVIIYMFFNRAWFDSRFIMLAGWIFAIFFVGAGRVTARTVRAVLLRKLGFGRERVMLVGAGEALKKLEGYIKEQHGAEFHIVATAEASDETFLQYTSSLRGLHHIIMVDPNANRPEAMRLVAFCEERGIKFSYIPDLFGSMVADMHFDIIRGMPVVSVKPSPLDGWGRVVKRSVDILGAISGIIIFAPLFLLLAFLIKWESRGPVLVRLKRVSQGREFYLYKFRSMVDNAERYKPYLAHLNERVDGPLFKITDDPRITRVGKILRARRLDEIPQFINVLQGDISLVGPRPHEPEEVKRYANHHKKVLALKAGLTGFAQVNGASELPFEEEVKLDRHYIENWSLKKDVYILLRTFWMLLFDKSGV